MGDDRPTLARLDADILAAVQAAAPLVRLPVGAEIHSLPLLLAFCYSESSWGRDRYVPRQEPGYSPGGKYFNAALWRRYGALSAMSFGWAQVMYPVAVELAQRPTAAFSIGHPWELMDARVCAGAVVEYLNQRAFSGPGPAMTVEDVGDAYNSGTCRDANTVPEYRKRIRTGYDAAVAWLAQKSA